MLAKQEKILLLIGGFLLVLLFALESKASAKDYYSTVCKGAAEQGATCREYKERIHWLTA